MWGSSLFLCTPVGPAAQWLREAAAGLWLFSNVLGEQGHSLSSLADVGKASKFNEKYKSPLQAAKQAYHSSALSSEAFSKLAPSPLFTVQNTLSLFF